MTFVSLLVRLEDADALGRLIDSLRLDTTPPSRPCLVPTTRGAAFFATGRASPHRGDVAAVTPRGRLVYLVMNDPGLRDVARGVDGVFVVGIDPASSDMVDPRWHLVRTTVGDAPLALAETAMKLFTPTVSTGRPAVFAARAASLVGSIRAAHRDRTVSGVAITGSLPPTSRRSVTRTRPLLPSLLETAERPVVSDPVDLLLDASSRRSSADAQPPAVPPRRPVQRRVGSWRSGRGMSRVVADQRLADRIVGRSSTIVVVGSRKGGVGKTSHAAGVAIVAGTVLDTVGHRAAILDANIANPDAWGYFDLPAEATTVRALASALARGQTAPRPVNARTPALACFPETRQGVEYSRTDVRRLAAHLRDRFSFVVVDMSNRLPDPTAGPEAAAAAYWLAEADALVLPTACSRQDFNAVLEFLDIDDLPPVVVPCIVPTTRRNRRHPVTQQYLADIADRVNAIVEMPDDADRVRRAGLDGVAVQDLSAALRSAYRQLTEAIADLPARRRR